ncbi:hypothetical protein BJ912DRAFT_979286 [Pholiota molesta]|nr:hypothetical protein BJ912DRAFT_979286 [Pholiota molesta]
MQALTLGASALQPSWGLALRPWVLGAQLPPPVAAAARIRLNETLMISSVPERRLCLYPSDFYRPDPGVLESNKC